MWPLDHLGRPLHLRMLVFSQIVCVSAGRIFARAFAEAHAKAFATATGGDAAAAAAHPAYEAAKTAVLQVTELGRLSNGLQAAVQRCADRPTPSSHAVPADPLNIGRYDLAADPKDSALVQHGRLRSGGKTAAGVPCLLGEPDWEDEWEELSLAQQSKYGAQAS